MVNINRFLLYAVNKDTLICMHLYPHIVLLLWDKKICVKYSVNVK